MSPEIETIADLLVRAFDMLEDLTDEDSPHEDEPLTTWLSDAAAEIQRLTGKTARELVDIKHARSGASH